MAKKEIRALLIEDNPADAMLMEETFAGTESVSIQIQVAQRLSDGIDRLRRGGIDVVMLDLDLPDSRGLTTLTRLRSQVPQVPVVVVTGQDDPALAKSVLREGAHEFFVKNGLDGSALVHAIRYAILRQGVEAVRDDVDTRELPTGAGATQSWQAPTAHSSGTEAETLPDWQKRIFIHRVGYVLDALASVGSRGSQASIPVRLQSIADELRKRNVTEKDLTAIVAACVDEKTSEATEEVRQTYRRAADQMRERLMAMLEGEA